MREAACSASEVFLKRRQLFARPEYYSASQIGYVAFGNSVSVHLEGIQIFFLRRFTRIFVNQRNFYIAALEPGNVIVSRRRRRPRRRCLRRGVCHNSLGCFGHCSFLQYSDCSVISCATHGGQKQNDRYTQNSVFD